MAISQPTILIIDDQPSIRRMLADVFGGEGYNVVNASNGYEGIQMASDIRPDAILMDMKMPGINGIEVIKEIKRQNQCHKIIVMTAYGEQETIKEVQSTGVRDYLFKPFDIKALLELVEKMITDLENQTA